MERMCGIGGLGRKTTDRLVRIAYVSIASRALLGDDLRDIAARSERNNAAEGITGLLLFGGGTFQGLLEGPQAAVLARMEAIIADDRHHSLRVLHERDVFSGRFRSWTFGTLPDDPTRGGLQSSGLFMQGLAARLGK